MKKKAKTNSSYILHINRDLWNAFKSKCASQGTSIVDTLTTFIKVFTGVK